MAGAPIPIELFCLHEEVEITFVQALHDRGLIQLRLVQERWSVAPEDLPRLERLARLHYEMDINLEGIEAISHMLERVQRMQEELHALQGRLRAYEGDDR